MCIRITCTYVTLCIRITCTHIVNTRMQHSPDGVLLLYSNNKDSYQQPLYSTTARLFVVDPLLHPAAAAFTREAPLLERLFHIDNRFK